MVRLITDFDGPIIDVSARYYHVYQFCLEQIKRPNQTIKQLPPEQFWQFKRSRVPEYEIAHFSGLDSEQSQAFAQLRHEIVHSFPYLIHDQLIANAVNALEKAQNLGIELVIMTLRRVQELNFALDRFSLNHFFAPNHRYCLPFDHGQVNDIQDKCSLMAQALQELPPTSQVWMVGDTEADIIAAKTHQIKSIGILSGIRDRPQLEQHHPTLILNNLDQAVDFIWQQSLQLAG